MVRNNNNATRRSLRALQLIAALALFAVSCGGSGEARNRSTMRVKRRALKLPTPHLK